jgi:hypothetical protein
MNLYFPFDNSTQTYLEYEGFDLSKLYRVYFQRIYFVDDICRSYKNKTS